MKKYHQIWGLIRPSNFHLAQSGSKLFARVSADGKTKGGSEALVTQDYIKITTRFKYLFIKSMSSNFTCLWVLVSCMLLFHLAIMTCPLSVATRAPYIEHS